MRSDIGHVLPDNAEDPVALWNVNGRVAAEMEGDAVDDDEAHPRMSLTETVQPV